MKRSLKTKKGILWKNSKTIKDWEEYSQFQQTTTQMSILEIKTALEQEQNVAQGENMLIMCGCRTS